MSDMSDTTDASPRMTKGELAIRGIDAVEPAKAHTMKISGTAGGVAFASALEVMDFARLMAVSLQAVPKDFRNNPGMCLAVTFQAIEWRMSPFQVANKAYVVNDRVAFESQLIHAVVEARAPLKNRLDCKYSGKFEDGTRTCTVNGTFINGDVRDYTTPEIGKIKVKNSPLWTSDPDQQLWYYATRSWARKWVPDVLMGIYSKEEIEAEPGIGRDQPTLPGLRARLPGDGDKRHDEGFDHGNGHVESELSEVVVSRPGQAVKPADGKPSQPAAQEARPTRPAPASSGGKNRTGKHKAKPKTKAEIKAAADRAETRSRTAPKAETSKPKTADPKPEPKPEPPKEPATAAEYVSYDWRRAPRSRSSPGR